MQQRENRLVGDQLRTDAASPLRGGWTKEPHNHPASFETRPLRAPQDEDKPLMA